MVVSTKEVRKKNVVRDTGVVAKDISHTNVGEIDENNIRSVGQAILWRWNRRVHADNADEDDEGDKIGEGVVKINGDI